MKKTIVLAILDGWGVGEMNESNPIYMAEPKAINMIQAYFPAAALQASGIAVGLPWEEVGNSEVGHLTIGAGKIIYQHFPKISMSIEDGSFFENPALKGAFAHARNNNSAVHAIGLLTEGSVHAALKHLVALLDLAEKEKCQRFFLHLFTDGKDSSPRAALRLLKDLTAKLEEKKVGKISSIMGRYWAMDRDGHWERTRQAYNAIIGEAPKIQSAEDFVGKNYEKGIDDELIPAATIADSRSLGKNDAVIFFNFREDSMRQLTESFLNEKFDKFPIKRIENLYIATFTQYDERFRSAVAFPKEKIENPLGKVLADNGKIQLRIAETEKYAHATYFFNGLREAPFPNEYRILIPSQKVLHHDDRPEMMAKEITDRALISLNEGNFDFILINYANPDIIAHTGNYDATLQAVKTIDREIERLMKAVMQNDQFLIITSDHGNAEALIDLKTGEKETRHDPNPVPIYLVGRSFKKAVPVNIFNRLPVIGLLSDIAPTILEIMGIPKPSEMTGQSLLRELTRI
jgi:2,3-bisphosphoglycerate-independent phosphoglycerate mutase